MSMTLSPWPQVLILVLALSLTPGKAADTAVEPLFVDDFSTGDISKHNAWFRWGRSGSIPAPGSSAQRIVEVEGPEGTPVKALRFRYTGTQDGGTGDQLHWSEMRFHLTQRLEEQRTERGPSDTAYQEVWIAYRMRVPSNHFHHERRPSNNKGWLYLWKNSYEQWSTKVADDVLVTPTSASLHWWHAPGNTSKATAVHSRERRNWGHRQPSFVAEPRLIPSRGSDGFVFLPEEQGQWVRYAFGIRAASDSQTKDGFIRVYIDETLTFAWEDTGGGSDRPECNGYDRGYILGWHNAPYPETTEYLLTDFIFGTSPRSVGIDPREAVSPDMAGAPAPGAQPPTPDSTSP